MATRDRPGLLARAAAVAALAAAVRATPAAAQEPSPVAGELPPSARALEDATQCLGLDVPRVRFDAAGLSWRLGAYATVDAVNHDHDDPRDDRVGFTDLRPLVEAESGRFALRIEGDALGMDTPRNLYEAWASWEAAPWARISAGQFRVALGTEHATREADLPWVGYSFPAHVAGRHDVGVRADGAPADGLWYQAAAVAGRGFGLEGHRITSSQLSLRAVAHPFRLAGVRETDAAFAPFRGVFLGAAYARLGDGDDPVIVATPLQSVVFRTNDLGGDGGSRVLGEIGWTLGPVQLGLERVVGAVDGVPVRGGGTTDLDELTAYSWSLAWNLTGEPRGWRDGAFVPADGPSPPDRTFEFLPAGRWELGLRYSNADLDRRLFTGGRASHSVASQESHTYTAVLFWGPCARLRFGLGWTQTIADDAVAGLGGRKRGSSAFLRVELRF